MRDLAKAGGARGPPAFDAALELIELDLASLKSVRAARTRLNAKGHPFDLVIANAGVMAIPTKTSRQMASRHSSAPTILATSCSSIASRRCSNPGARLVNLSSAGHRYSDVNLDDPNFERTEYSDFGAYGRSKTANILFAVEFDRRHQARGVRATAVHPGGIQTELSRHMAPDALEANGQAHQRRQRRRGPAAVRSSRPSRKAPRPSVWAGVVAPAEDVGGRYCEDCHVAEIIDGGADLRARRAPLRARCRRAKALWAKSEEMVDERF